MQSIEPAAENASDELSEAPDAQTILIIDDSKTVRATASRLLESQGYAVETAVDGFDALAKVVNSRPKLVLCDIMMPRLDGYQTCSLIKNNEDYSDIPVVMLSSKDGLFDKAKGRIVGCDDYITKPFGREELLETVGRYFKASSNDSLGESAGE